jgi:hypothetical protein
MLAKNLQSAKEQSIAATGLISHARGPTDQGRESDGDPARPCTRSATGSFCGDGNGAAKGCDLPCWPFDATGTHSQEADERTGAGPALEGSPLT